MRKSSHQPAADTTPIQILGYGLPRTERDRASRTVEFDGFQLVDVPLPSPESFLNFDGVILLAGAYERYKSGYGYIDVECIAPADLDLRERELFTALGENPVIIFLVHNLPTERLVLGSHSDLFRRAISRFGITLSNNGHPSPFVESTVPEFKDYISRFGAGYVRLFCGEDNAHWVAPICTSSDHIFGVALFGKVFILPCAFPQNRDQLTETIRSAVHSALAYRRRMSHAMPEWVGNFAFTNEVGLRDKANALRTEVAQLESEVDTYVTFKGALCLQSNPLVESVSGLLLRFFGITLDIDDKCIEDATLRQDGTIIAVFEIKGIRGNFARNHVNQVDSHRERLGVPSSTPGILIINTMMSAESLADKDGRPHPDIVKKAAADNVLLIRTLDLLRYADAIERGVLTPESFRSTILTNTGWLQVNGDSATVIKE